MRASGAAAEDELTAGAEDEAAEAADEADVDFAALADALALPAAEADEPAALALFAVALALFAELACEDACATPWLAEDDPPLPLGENAPRAKAAMRPTTTTATTTPMPITTLFVRFGG